MWVYQQSSGKIFHTSGLRHEAVDAGPKVVSVLLGVGYSGNGKGLNNPEMQHVRDVGPIPQGDYYIGPRYDHPEHGPVVMKLNPEPGTNTFSRDNFLMHGDLKGHEGENLASKGCVIMPRWIRERVSESGDHLLRVIA